MTRITHRERSAMRGHAYSGTPAPDFLRCYVSGEPLGSRFYLVSLRGPTDRVFVVSPGAVARIDGDHHKVLVEIKGRKG